MLQCSCKVGLSSPVLTALIPVVALEASPASRFCRAVLRVPSTECLGFVDKVTYDFFVAITTKTEFLQGFPFPIHNVQPMLTQ